MIKIEDSIKRTYLNLKYKETTVGPVQIASDSMIGHKRNGGSPEF